MSFLFAFIFSFFSFFSSFFFESMIFFFLCLIFMLLKGGVFVYSIFHLNILSWSLIMLSLFIAH